MQKIDHRTGWTLGLGEPYADLPAYQIINDTHDQFLSLVARLTSLQFGSQGIRAKSHPLWPAIAAARTEFAARLRLLGGNAVAAVELSQEIERLAVTVRGIEAELAEANR